ncbi:MAG: ribosome biogenesis GTP-binding protein YihA/YsxC [Bdellovibrionota bacterium]
MNRPKQARNPDRLQYLTSAVDLQGCPEDTVPEVAFVGRSNAGKSTLINGIAGARIAQTSSTPGKTTMLNFYSSKHYRLVDMPGYGFSARSGDQQASWKDMIEPYLATRGNLVGLVIIMDIRRDWTKDEQDLVDWFGPRDLPMGIVLTKADKLSKTEIAERAEAMKADTGCDDVLVTSSLKKTGFEDVEEFIFHTFIKVGET